MAVAPVADRGIVRDLIADLVAIESVNPTLVPGGRGEADVARYVADWLDRNGIETDYRELGPGRANVVGRVPGTGSGRALLLNAHTDTVALGGADAGLTTRTDGNRLYGRGAYDMKGGLAAAMLTAASAARAPLGGDLIVGAVADEEAQSIGTEALLETVRADAAIVTEPTELRLAIAHKGFVWLDVETQGVAAHGSRYDLGVDAIARMGPALAGLSVLDERLRADGHPHPLLGGPSVHASAIEGGQELSSYPDRCLLRVERRTLPGETVELVEEELRALGGETSVTTTVVREPLETSRDAEIVATLLEQAEDVLGAAPDVVGVPFWTDAGLISAAGIPAVVFGPGGAGAHADVEWVDLDDVVRCIDVLVATARAFCA